MSKKSLLQSAIAIPFIFLIVVSAWVSVLMLAIKALLLVLAVFILFITLSYVWQKCKDSKAVQGNSVLSNAGQSDPGQSDGGQQTDPTPSDKQQGG